MNNDCCPVCLNTMIHTKNSICLDPVQQIYLTDVPFKVCTNVYCGVQIRPELLLRLITKIADAVRAKKITLMKRTIQAVAYDVFIPPADAVLCSHPNTHPDVCDVVLLSIRSVLLLDVPCTVCNTCFEIASVEQPLLQQDAIDAVSLNEENSYGCIETRPQTTHKRNEWKGIRIKYRKDPRLP